MASPVLLALLTSRDRLSFGLDSERRGAQAYAEAVLAQVKTDIVASNNPEWKGWTLEELDGGWIVRGPQDRYVLLSGAAKKTQASGVYSGVQVVIGGTEGMGAYVYVVDDQPAGAQQTPALSSSPLPLTRTSTAQTLRLPQPTGLFLRPGAAPMTPMDVGRAVAGTVVTASAIGLSYHRNHSIGYALLHGLISPLYLAYRGIEALDGKK